MKRLRHGTISIFCLIMILTLPVILGGCREKQADSGQDSMYIAVVPGSGEVSSGSGSPGTPIAITGPTETPGTPGLISTNPTKSPGAPGHISTNPTKSPGAPGHISTHPTKTPVPPGLITARPTKSPGKPGGGIPDEDPLPPGMVSTTTPGGGGTFGTAVTQTLKEQAVRSRAKNIDLVFCLDTSGSMKPLIDAAREKLWDIARSMKALKPEPKLRIALIVYGTPAYGADTGWVRVESDFTPDIDSIKNRLAAIKCSGGSEYVACALQVALQNLSWGDAKGTMRTIFIAGNERAGQDPNIALDYICQEAVKNGTIINTIYCGREIDLAVREWKQVALYANGKFSAVSFPAGSGGGHPVSLPPLVKLPGINTPEGKAEPFHGRITGIFNGNTVMAEENAPSPGKSHMLKMVSTTKYSPATWRPASGDIVLIYPRPTKPDEIYQVVSQK